MSTPIPGIKTIEEAVVEKERKKRSYAGKKRNNVKKPANYLCDTSASKLVMACTECRAKREADQARLNAYQNRASVTSISSDEMIEIQNLSSRLSQPEPTVIHDASGDSVCSGCGLVLSRSAALASDYNDFERVFPGSKARTRENYFGERLSQWMLQEPEIPLADRERIRDAYNGGYGGVNRQKVRDPTTGEERESGEPGLDPRGGVLMFDPDLNKDTIRLILIRAGLATKKYTEKWLTIRHKILGAPRHPDPELTSPGLYSFLLERFKTVVSIWEREGPSLCPPGHERKSLFNYNYLIEQLLLQHSVESYNLHSPWFPVKESDKVDALWTMWCGICAHADWPAYKPVWSADGRKVIDRKVASVPLQLQFRVRQRVKRPGVSKDKRPMKQTKLKE